MPISDEVSELVYELGDFYTEVDQEGEEAEENEVDQRPFTRPFASHTGIVRDQQRHNNSTLEGTSDIQPRDGAAAQVGCSTAVN